MLSIQGNSTLYPGFENTWNINGMIDTPLAGIDRIYLGAVTLTDAAGTTTTPSCRLFGGHGTPAYTDGPRLWYPLTDSPLWLRMPAIASVGAYTLAATFEASSPDLRAAGTAGPTQTLNATIRVAPTPMRPFGTGLPAYASWKQNMGVLADKWGPPILANTLGLEAYYYSMAAVYWQISDYLRTNKYNTVAIASADQYAAFLQSCGGKCQGYVMFADSLRMTWERTQNSKYRDALLLLLNNPWIAYPGDPDPVTIRETAYTLMTLLEFQKVGQYTVTNAAGAPVLTLIQANQAAAFLLGHFDQLFVQELRSSPNQPFWAGLAAEALIRWYEVTQDPRVIVALRRMCDYIWEHGVDPNTGLVLYNLWVTDPAAEGYGNFSSLNLLMVNAWGFLWKVTGDAVYRDQGDKLFLHFADNEGITFSAKVFAQNYWLSFRYVRYRS